MTDPKEELRGPSDVARAELRNTLERTLLFLGQISMEQPVASQAGADASILQKELESAMAKNNLQVPTPF